MRGRLIVILEAFWAVGWTAAALIGFLVIPGSDNGWRWAFALGAIPAAYALVVRWGFPSRRGGSRGEGGHAEAEAVVALRGSAAEVGACHDRGGPRRCGCRRGAVGGERLARAVVAGVPGANGVPVAGVVLRQLLLLRRVHLDPSILVSQGYDLVRSFGFTLIITLAQLPGYAVAAWLIEVWGRRLTLSVFLAGSAVAGDPLRHGERPRRW